MSIPKQPRQQMINIMYLALTALLALNVSSEVLNAFKLINDKLTVSNEAAESKTATLMGMFESKYNNNPAKTKPYLDDATLVRNMVHDFYTYTEQLKSQLIEQSGGVAQGKIVGSKNVDVTTRVMIEHASGVELERKVNELREKLLALPMVQRLLPEERARLESQLSLNTLYDLKDAERLGKKSWATYNFERVPVIAAVTMLAKLQGDAKEAEARVLERLYTGIDESMIAIEGVSPIVTTSNSYVLANQQQFNANIRFGATIKTQEIEVFMGKFKSGLPVRDEAGELLASVGEFPLQDGFTQLPVVDGIAQFSELPSRPGDQNREGVMKIKTPDGTGFNYYPFEINYKAAQPAAIVSPDRINLLYAGLENPVSVSVPGYPAEKVRAQLLSDKGTITGSNGSYMVKMNETGRAKIRVNVMMDNGKEVNMGEMEFRVKNVPLPTAEVGGLTDSEVEVHTFRIQRALHTVLKDFEWDDVNFKVVHFRLARERGGEIMDAYSTESAFPPKMKELVEGAKRGDRYFFEEIRVIDPTGKTRKIPGIMFRMK